MNLTTSDLDSRISKAEFVSTPKTSGLLGSILNRDGFLSERNAPEAWVKLASNAETELTASNAALEACQKELAEAKEELRTGHEIHNAVCTELSNARVNSSLVSKLNNELKTKCADLTELLEVAEEAVFQMGHSSGCYTESGCECNCGCAETKEKFTRIKQQLEERK